MANRGNTWSVPAGQSEAYTVTIANEAGAITGQYAGNEPLSVSVWQGGDLAAIADVCSAGWLSAADGTITATVAPAADLAPGWYRVRIAVTYGGDTSPVYHGWIRVEAVPGTAAEPPTYGTLQDLVDLAGDWLERLMQGEAGDRTNFLAERARARSWLDDIIIGASRPFAARFDPTSALSYGSSPYGPVESPDSVIRDALAADALLVVPRTIESASYKALAYICEKRQAFDADGDQYRARALFYHRMAGNSLRRYRPELDTDGDGQADIAFNLGVVSVR